jgi:putative hydrolase of the HAD superfamily
MPRQEVIACDLDADRSRCGAGWRAVGQRVEIVERSGVSGGFRTTLRGAREAVEAAEHLAAAERECCVRADWRLSRTADGAVLEAQGMDRTARVSVRGIISAVASTARPAAAGGQRATTRASFRPAPSQTTERADWQAVIFDLWDTLVEFPWELAKAHFAAMASQLSVDAERLRLTWRKLEPAWETMPLTASLQLLSRELGVNDADIEQLRGLRLAFMRRALKPRAEVIETLREVRGRGFRLGLISACSGDVPAVWSETPLADLIDVTVFSCVVGFCKPDLRIYQLASSELGVQASRCLYVGDGGHDELGGAARAGMTAVLLQTGKGPSSSEPLGWTARIGAISEVLSLL